MRVIIIYILSKGWCEERAKNNLAICEKWMAFRGQLVTMCGWHVLEADELTLRLLGVGPESASFSVILTWVAAIDDAATFFWASR